MDEAKFQLGAAADLISFEAAGRASRVRPVTCSRRVAVLGPIPNA